MLFHDAGCLTDEQQAAAVEQVTAYTTTLQTELQLVGYYDGPIDGIYGPLTVDGVKRLQADSDLPETGFVDKATAEALDTLLAELDLQTAAADLTHTAAVQTVLTLTGFWHGPVDGVWTDELTASLQEFQIALGVEPTGIVDAATLAAFQQALADLQTSPTPTTTSAPTTPVATRPVTPPAATAPVTTTSAPAASGEATVLVADSDLGQILTAANGMTVYLFTPDAQGAPTARLRATRRGALTVETPVSSPVATASTRRCSAPPSTRRRAIRSRTTAGRSTSSQATPPPATPTARVRAAAWYVVDPTGNAIDND